MSNKEILERLKEAIIELDEEGVYRLIKEGLEAKLSPMELIMQGMSPGLTVIGQGFETGERFMSDLVIAGEVMLEAVDELRPIMEAGGERLGENFVIGTVEGDVHTIGKRIVAAIFTGAGYSVIDIGEDAPASKFVDAAKEYKATIVGASAILSPVKAYCGVIEKALVDAGIRDEVIYIVGGWGMTQAYSDSVRADAYGEDAIDALNKVRMIKAGELPKFRERMTRV